VTDEYIPRTHSLYTRSLGTVVEMKHLLLMATMCALVGTTFAQGSFGGPEIPSGGAFSHSVEFTGSTRAQIFQAVMHQFIASDVCKLLAADVDKGKITMQLLFKDAEHLTIFQPPTSASTHVEILYIDAQCFLEVNVTEGHADFNYSQLKQMSNRAIITGAEKYREFQLRTEEMAKGVDTSIASLLRGS
jgi:hypothetical protein